MTLGAVIFSNACTIYFQVRKGSQYSSRMVILLGVVGIFQFLRAFVLKFFCQNTGGNVEYQVVSIIEVIYVFLDLSAYWHFHFKYWTTSLAIDGHYEEIARIKDEHKCDKEECDHVIRLATAESIESQD